jgi:hypothetical protein
MAQGVLTAQDSLPSGAVHVRPSLGVLLAWIQAPYYFLTGVWPFISIRSFQYVTGQKYDHLPNGGESDHWLVLAVGALITAVAVTLFVAAWRRNVQLEIAVLAIGAAVGLTAIDIVYVARQVISPIYLLDAVIEVPLIVGWLTVLARQVRSGDSHR